MKLLYMTYICFILFMFFITPAALLQAASPLTVHDPWVLESPPGMKVMAAYMNLTNESEKDRIITAVSSPDFNRVEMHKTVIDNDQASMMKQESMTIKAGQDLAFQPGGHHFMLIGPKKPVTSGESVAIQLTLSSGENIDVIAPVRKFNEMQHNKGEHSH